MSEKYKVIDSSVPTFITITVVGWVDLFIRRRYTEILDESLNYCIKQKGLKVHAYVYMTSHIHLMISSENGKLQDIVRDFKKFTSRKLMESILQDSGESRKNWIINKFSYEAKRLGRTSKYKLWKDGFHPVILDDANKIIQRRNYIHYNPVDAGFVFHEREWKNSSYGVYEEGNREVPQVELMALYDNT